MTMKTQIKQVGTIFIPVADQDRALTFYRETLGFEKRGDFTYGGGSPWIEVAPPEVSIKDPLPPQFSFRDPDGNRCQTGGRDRTIRTREPGILRSL